MGFPKRDVFATALVALAVVLYVLWTVDLVPPGFGVRATGSIILVLGLGASLSAVVPYFSDLIQGSKGYLAIASLIGLVAFGAGIWTLVESSAVGLGVLTASMGILWLMATIRHIRLNASPRVGGSVSVLEPTSIPTRSRETV
jgi:hypothetical protein